MASSAYKYSHNTSAERSVGASSLGNVRPEEQRGETKKERERFEERDRTNLSLSARGKGKETYPVQSHDPTSIERPLLACTASHRTLVDAIIQTITRIGDEKPRHRNITTRYWEQELEKTLVEQSGRGQETQVLQARYPTSPGVPPLASTEGTFSVSQDTLFEAILQTITRIGEERPRHRGDPVQHWQEELQISLAALTVQEASTSKLKTQSPKNPVSQATVEISKPKDAVRKLPQVVIKPWQRLTEDGMIVRRSRGKTHKKQAHATESHAAGELEL